MYFPISFIRNKTKTQTHIHTHENYPSPNQINGSKDVHFLQVACSIVHNSPSPIPNDRFHPQRRHSAISHAYQGRSITHNPYHSFLLIYTPAIPPALEYSY